MIMVRPGQEKLPKFVGQMRVQDPPSDYSYIPMCSLYLKVVCFIDLFSIAYQPFSDYLRPAFYVLSFIFLDDKDLMIQMITHI